MASALFSLREGKLERGLGPPFFLSAESERLTGASALPACVLGRVYGDMEE